MSTPHNSAERGDIAETILLPGDPLRAQRVAENYLEDVVCYNRVRGMLGFTGTYHGTRVSVQGTGMGMPSISIYAHELINMYGVKRLIRIGSCGGLHKETKLHDLIIAVTASTDSAINRNRLDNIDYAPAAAYPLLRRAVEEAEKRSIAHHVGMVMSGDIFYGEDSDRWKKWALNGILAVEMETNALYSLAARYKAEALSLLTVSDNLVTSKETTAEERQKSFTNMMEVALEASRGD